MHNALVVVSINATPHPKRYSDVKIVLATRIVIH
jgi:hypothetical protein